MKNLIYLFAAFFLVAIAGTKANAQTIATHTEYDYPSWCGVTSFVVTTTGCTSGQNIMAYFGDGTSSSSLGVRCFGPAGHDTVWHTYATTGTYTVKLVLFSGTTRYDSVVFIYSVLLHCRMLPVEAYIDANSNCVCDAGETGMFGGSTFEIDSAGVPIDTCTMLSGAGYVAYGPPGTVYAFKLLTPPGGLSVTCPSTGILYDTVPATSAAATTKYFGFACSSSSSTFDLKIWAGFWPALAGRFANYAFIYLINSTCSGTAATVKFDFSPRFAFRAVYPSTLTYTVTGTTVTINAGTVINNMPECILVALTPTSTLTLGDTVNTRFTVTPTTGDADTTNNVVVRCDTVKAALDPNRKSVTPSGDITAGTRLEYMLEFENDGNDTAHNIHIMDTLSSYLDISTFRTIASTHQVNVLRYNDSGANILKFDFPNIMLPDSIHHDVCRGMVSFSIKAKSTLAPGTVIANRVGIYFDTNPVVMTNTVYSKIPVPGNVRTQTHLSQVELYPNPVTDVLTIKAEAGAYKTLSIYNITGQLVNTQDIGQAEVKVNVHSLVPGIYYVTLKGANGNKTIKFEKQ